MQKFRAYDKQTNKMYYSPNEHIYLNIDGTCVNFQNGEILEVMFAIGRTDKNDKNIYGGDICRNGDYELDAHCHNYRIDEVFWDHHNACWQGWNPNEFGMNCEVVGNIKQHKIEDFT